jgi:glycosyltransferase involved in cell wall biosynthesis
MRRLAYLWLFENTSGGISMTASWSVPTPGDQAEIISLPWRNYAHHLGDNFSTRLWHRLRELEVDILLQDELNHPSLFWINRQLTPWAGYPIISIVHHLRSCEVRPAWQNLLYGLVERRYLAGVAGFVFNSQTTCNVVRATLVTDPPGVIAYPAGDHLTPTITEDEILARSLQPGPLRILFVGNLIPRKGLHTLLRALVDLHPQTWMLEVIATHCRYSIPIIINFIEGKCVGERVSLRGLVSAEILEQSLRTSQLLAVTSSYEGFGIVYLEAMGYGLPCIATTAGATGEIITHGQDGFLFQTGDLHGLTEHLAHLSRDRQLLARMGLVARLRYTNHPTWAQTGETIRNFLLSWLK